MASRDRIVVGPGQVDPAGGTVLAWWRRLAIAGGVVSLLLGVILLIWPRETLVVVAVLLGLWLIISGVIKLVQSLLTPEGRTGGARVMQALGGLVLIAIGVLFVRHITDSLELIAALIGIAWLLAGAVEIWSAFSGPAHAWTRAGQVLFGIITMLGGLIVVCWPKITLVVLVALTGIWLVIIGLAQIVFAWRVKPD